MKQKEMYNRLAVGKRLKERRRQLGWTRGFVAGRIGLGEKYYGDIERGYCGMSIETLIGLTRLMGFTMDGLIYGEEGVQGLKQEEVLLKNLGSLPEQAQDCCVQMLMLFMEGLGAGGQGATGAMPAEGRAVSGGTTADGAADMSREGAASPGRKMPARGRG